MAALGIELEHLRAEIERLTRELDQVSSENVQSAKYGLVLLEEKQNLQAKCDELESLYDHTKHELDITQEVSRKSATDADTAILSFIIFKNRGIPFFTLDGYATQSLVSTIITNY